MIILSIYIYICIHRDYSKPLYGSLLTSQDPPWNVTRVLLPPNSYRENPSKVEQ